MGTAPSQRVLYSMCSNKTPTIGNNSVIYSISYSKHDNTENTGEAHLKLGAAGEAVQFLGIAVVGGGQIHDHRLARSVFVFVMRTES